LSALIFIGIGDSIHSLKPLFFEFKEVPITFFGYVFAIGYALSSLGHYISHDISEKITDKGTLILGAFFLTLSIFLSTFFGTFFAVFSLLIGQVFYGIGRPATEHLINLETGSGTRATVISGYNFMRHLGVAIFVPLIGLASDAYSIGMGFRLGAIAMFSVPVLFLFLKNRR
jgi:sugar phosphate permease